MSSVAVTQSGGFLSEAERGNGLVGGLRSVERVGMDVLNIAHRAAHHLLDDVFACCYVATGTAPLKLCGKRSDGHSVIFQRLIGRALGSEMVVEKHRIDTDNCYASVVPLEAAEGVVGWLQILTRSAPALVTLDRITGLTAAEVDRPQAIGAPSEAQPRAQLVMGRDEASDLSAGSTAAPIVHELLRSAAVELDATIVLQSQNLIVMAGVGDIEQVRLDRAVWQGERELVLRAAALGELTMLPGKHGKPARVMASIYGGSDLLGYLVAGNCELTPWARGILDHCVEILSWILRVENDVASENEQRRAALVADLLSDSNLDSISARATALGHDLWQEHDSYAFTVDATDPSERCARLRKLAQLVRTESRKRAISGLVSLVGVVDNDVVAFVPSNDLSRPGFAEQVISAAGELDLTISCGIGTNCAEPGEFALAARQARRAVDILRHGNHWRTVTRYDDLGVFGLLFSEHDGSRLEKFVQRWLGPLLRYDGDSGAELTKTVELLLEHSTMMDAASSLHIHISTLKYRYKRIQELLKVDLHDPDTTFNLKLAVKIHRVLTQLTPSGN